MGSAILLSPDAQKKICSSVDYMFAEMQREVIKAMMVAKEKDPGEVPIPDEPGDFLNSNQLKRLRELLELDKTTPSAASTPKSVTSVVPNNEEKKR